jgi:hypothetical protein
VSSCLATPPSPLKHLKRIVAWKLESGDIPNRDFGCEMHL